MSYYASALNWCRDIFLVAVGAKLLRKHLLEMSREIGIYVHDTLDVSM
jgi:hypothetical protein